MTTDFIIIICVAGMAISLLLAFGFINKFKQPNIFLSLFFLCLSLNLTYEYFILTEKILLHPWIAELSVFLPVAIPPLIYFYVAYQEGKQFTLKHSIHFIPAILFFVNFIPLYTSSKEFRSCYLHEELYETLPSFCPPNYELVRTTFVPEEIMDVLMILVFLIYASLIYQRRKRVSAQKTKKASPVFLSWGNLIVVLIVLALICQLIDVYLLTEDQGYFNILYLSSIIFVIGVFIVRQSVLLQSHIKSDVYKKVDSNELAELYRALQESIRREQLFKDSSLTIQKVASNLNIPANKISYMLNEQGINFRKLINEMRIESALLLLASDQSTNSYTLEGIGQEVGYKSKTTFYKHFKEKTGQTPKQYLESKSN